MLPKWPFKDLKNCKKHQDHIQLQRQEFPRTWHSPLDLGEQRAHWGQGCSLRTSQMWLVDVSVDGKCCLNMLGQKLLMIVIDIIDRLMSLIYHWYHWYHYQFDAFKGEVFLFSETLRGEPSFGIEDHAKTGCREGYEAPRHNLRMAQVCFQKRMEDQSIRHPMETLTFFDGNLKECQCLWHWPCGPKLCACAEKDCHGTVSKFNKVLSPSSHQSIFEFFNFEKVDIVIWHFCRKRSSLEPWALKLKRMVTYMQTVGTFETQQLWRISIQRRDVVCFAHSPRCNRVPILQNRAMCRHPGPKRMRCGNPEFCGYKRWYEVYINPCGSHRSGEICTSHLQFIFDPISAI